MEHSEYGNLRTNEVLEQKRRQQLRANNHELLQLERHLQSALVYKQQNEQKQYAAQLKEDELRKKREENVRFNGDCEKIRLSILQQEEQEKQKKKALLETLKCQINEMQQKRLTELEDANKDREEMVKLMKQIQAEEILKQKDTELLCEIYKKEMKDTFSNIRLKQQLERERNDDENKRNFEYQSHCDRIKFQREEERKLLQKERDQLTELLGQQLSSINFEKDKREDLLLSLLIEERKAKNEKDFKEALIKKFQARQKIRVENEHYRIEIRTQKEKQFKEEEEKFREENMRYLEEQDKLWQLSEEKRRRKILDHNKQLREMIEKRRYQKANKIAEQIADLEKIKIDVEKSETSIEQERVLMLSSVPRDLLGYLSPGVLKPSDTEFLKLL